MKCPQCGIENPDGIQFCSECAAPLIPGGKGPTETTQTFQNSLQELSTGSIFAGRYKIIEELEKGGMGRIYKAFDTEVNEKVALKLIKPEISTDAKAIERFRNELKYARKIAHRNVCRMFDLGKEGGNFYITMEYIAGEDLKSFIKRSGRLTIAKAVSLTKQVCGGLAEAHRLHVVHRDLKPKNIMIDIDGNARILDFGIARSLQSEGITGEGVMIGTPEYMSPEQVETKDVDSRSDIYSLGIILFEMLTGRLPFTGETPLSVAMKQKTSKPPDPQSLNPQIPADLNRMIFKCLEKDRNKRYQSVEEILNDLNKIESEIPTTETIVPKMYFHPMFLSSLGQAYFQNGDLNRAQEEYEKIQSLTLHKLQTGDYYAKSYYWLGKIFQKKGERSRAVENYETFLDLWKDADSGIFELEDARSQLASLDSY